jgi:serine/threonine-protein kinase
MLDARDLVATQVGGARLDRVVGPGTSTWVYAGHAMHGGPPVAVKVLNPRYADEGPLEERFRREAAIAARLSHNNVVRILDQGRDGGLRYFTMPLYPASLASMIHDRTIDEGTAVRIGRDVACGLAVAHRIGLVHRDVKPANVLIADDGRAVIADFGIAQSIIRAAPAGEVHMTLGTPHYISPEQAQGRPLDGRADLYALGVALYRATTGRAPFHSTDWFTLARQHVEEAPASPRRYRPELSPAFEQVVLRCLAKHPADRYPTADALALALGTVRAAGTGS